MDLMYCLILRMEPGMGHGEGKMTFRRPKMENATMPEGESWQEAKDAYRPNFDGDQIANYYAFLAGDDSQEAYAIRLAAFENLSDKERRARMGAIVNSQSLLRGLETSLYGMDDDNAWDLRKRMSTVPQYHHGLDRSTYYLQHATRSTLGLTSAASYEFRLQELNGAITEEERYSRTLHGPLLDVAKGVSYSLRGQDSEEAWTLRDKAVSSLGIGDRYEVSDLIGLDSERAWAAREKSMHQTAWMSSVSITGLDSDKAWALRDRMVKEGSPQYGFGHAWEGNFLESLAGVDSDRAWDVRDEKLKEILDLQSHVQSQGDNSREAKYWIKTLRKGLVDSLICLKDDERVGDMLKALNVTPDVVLYVRDGGDVKVALELARSTS